MLHPQHGLVEVGEALRCQQWEVVLQGWMRSNGGGYAMRVTVYDGKYTVVSENGAGLKALRYGEEWARPDRRRVDPGARAGDRDAA
jgi:fructose 1,6-bisphosphatase